MNGIHSANMGWNFDQNDARFTAASEGLARVLGQRRELQAELETFERSATDLVAHIDVERQRIGELEAALPALDADEQAEADAIARALQAMIAADIIEDEAAERAIKAIVNAQIIEMSAAEKAAQVYLSSAD